MSLGYCELCGKPGVAKCRMCGRTVCSEHYDEKSRLCKVCSMSLCEVCGRRVAIGRCVLCGRLGCEDCLVQVDNVRRICRECLVKVYDGDLGKARRLLKAHLSPPTSLLRLTLRVVGRVGV